MRETTTSMPTVRPTNSHFPMRNTPIADWRDAEKIAVAWMTALGFNTARATPGGADAGVDVRAPQVAIAQVKYRQSIIGRPEIQLLVGSRHPQLLEKTLFFSRSGYHRTALQWAELWNVALFRFDDFGNPFPENQAARSLCLKSGYGDWQAMTPPSDRWIPREAPRIHRELILSTTGKPVLSGRSATLAIKRWAAACGYGATVPEGKPGLVTANGLVILSRFSGSSINATEIATVAGYPGDRIRIAVSWVGFSKGAKRSALAHSVALFTCSAGGALQEANDVAMKLLAD